MTDKKKIDDKDYIQEELDRAVERLVNITPRQKKKIEKLELPWSSGNVNTTRTAPSNQDIINKINEIIEVLNESR